MFLDATHYDVYVTASGSEMVRRSTLARVLELYPLDAAGQAAFVRGERVRLQAKVSDEKAKRAVGSLRAFGVQVDLEEHRAALDAVGLDGFTSDEPAAAAPAPVENLFFNVNAGLVGLDGSDEDLGSSGSAAPAPAPAAPVPAGLSGLIGLSLSDADEPLAQDERKTAPATPPPRAGSPPSMPPVLPRPAPPPPPPRAAPPPAPVAAPPPPPAPAAPPSPTPFAAGEDARFRPSGSDSGPVELQVDRPPPDPMLMTTPSKPQRGDTFEAPRCPTHDVARVGGRCPRCDAEEAEVRGKLFGGALRNKLPLRVGIGLVAGLLLGWIATTPLSRRAERQVEFIREEARRERMRPLDEAQAHASQLENQADEESQNGFYRTLGVWALITAAVTGAWFRLT